MERHHLRGSQNCGAQINLNSSKEIKIKITTIIQGQTLKSLAIKCQKGYEAV